MVHVTKLNINGDPNIGLHGIATDKFCILGKSVTNKHAKEIESILKVPIIFASIYGTDYFGIFAIANSHTVLVPNIIFKSEKDYLKKELKKLNVKLKIIKTEHTALGNNILTNDTHTLISTVYTKTEATKIKEILNTKTKSLDFAHTKIPGSIGVLTNKGAIFSSLLSDQDIKTIEKFLKFEIGIGSINMGNPFLSSGIIANSYGFITGMQTTGFELARIDESLGFLKNE